MKIRSFKRAEEFQKLYDIFQEIYINHWHNVIIHDTLGEAIIEHMEDIDKMLKLFYFEQRIEYINNKPITFK